MTHSDIHKKAMVEALEKTLGIVSTACKIVGITRNTHYRWLKEDAEYASEVAGLAEVTHDFVESKLFELIEGVHVEKKAGDEEVEIYQLPPCKSSVIFYLKTRGRKRGYIEHRAVEESTPIENQTKAEVILPDGTKITL